MSDTMKALVLQAYNELVYTDAERPETGADEVLVEVRACGICGSDVHGMDGSSGRRHPPLIMGHEAAGVIAETGGRVAGFAVGDRVTFDSTIYCGVCSYCRRGLINLCDNRRVLGVAPPEYRRHGAFAEYVAVPERVLYRLPDELGFVQAALVEPVSIAVHAVSLTPVTLNDSAVVVGSGMVGLFVVQALRAAGCGTIIAVDLERHRLDLARRFGADHGILAGESDPIEQVHHLTGGRGADIAVEVVGSTAALDTAIGSLRKGGAATIVGNLAPTVEFPLQSVVTRQLSVSGSCSSCGEYPACLDMIARGVIDVDEMISAVAPLAAGAEWFARLRSGEEGLMKVVLTP